MPSVVGRGVLSTFETESVARQWMSELLGKKSAAAKVIQLESYTQVLIFIFMFTQEFPRIRGT